jgi:hypothetical protein
LTTRIVSRAIPSLKNAGSINNSLQLTFYENIPVTAIDRIIFIKEYVPEDSDGGLALDQSVVASIRLALHKSLELMLLMSDLFSSSKCECSG